jgi:hypothetical protein
MVGEELHLFVLKIANGAPNAQITCSTPRLAPCVELIKDLPGCADQPGGRPLLEQHAVQPTAWRPQSKSLDCEYAISGEYG